MKPASPSALRAASSSCALSMACRWSYSVFYFKLNRILLFSNDMWTKGLFLNMIYLQIWLRPLHGHRLNSHDYQQRLTISRHHAVSELTHLIIIQNYSGRSCIAQDRRWNSFTVRELTTIISILQLCQAERPHLFERVTPIQIQCMRRSMTCPQRRIGRSIYYHKTNDAYFDDSRTVAICLLSYCMISDNLFQNWLLVLGPWTSFRNKLSWIFLFATNYIVGNPFV